MGFTAYHFIQLNYWVYPRSHLNVRPIYDTHPITNSHSFSHGTGKMLTSCLSFPCLAKSVPRKWPLKPSKKKKSEWDTATELLHLCLQGSEAGLLRHGHFIKGHEHHEFFPLPHTQVCLRQGLLPDLLHKVLKCQPQGDLNSLVLAAYKGGWLQWVWGHQGYHQVHQPQVNCPQEDLSSKH